MVRARFEQRSVVDAPVADVWRRVTSVEGINDELRPLMTMTMPRDHRATTVADVPVGQPLGKAWIRLGGVLPVDYDALTVTELVPESHFQEVSTMGSMREWTHRRELRDADGRTEVVDTVGLTTRLGVGHELAARLVQRLFAHRHRRLARYFAERRTEG